MSLESYVVDAIEGKRKGRPFLHALSYLYRAGVALRHFAYDQKIFTTKKFRAKVISVGNIVTGGTGKTPLVHLLAKNLSSSHKVAILSRGYRSQLEYAAHPVRITPEMSVEACGDEPFWLSQHLPQVAVWVGKNRVLSAELAVQQGAEVLILDDGMQYRSLHRDLEIVVMEAEDLFGHGYFLPRGFLRDSPQRLALADLIVINRRAGLRSDVRPQLASFTEAPLVEVEMRVDADLRGKRVGVFCALARPERFMHAVRASGAEILATFFKPDHFPFTAEELHAFAKRSGAELLVCTEKDGVKLPANLSCIRPILPLSASLQFVAGKEQWDNILQASIL